MRYKGYVVTYAGELQKVNSENYFLNGAFKEDIEQKTYFDENREFGTRNLYGLSSGVGCEEAGEELARLSVELLNSFFGMDFNAENREYFKEANDAIRSHILGQSNKDFEVNTSVLYIEKDVARAYNIGSIPVFYFDGRTMKKLSGNTPEKVDIEKNFLGEGGMVLTDISEKKTVPFLGYADDQCEAVPFVSEPVRLNRKGFLILCSKAVVDVVGEDGIQAVLKDKSVKSCDKASKIIDKAIEVVPDGTYSVEIVEVVHGLPVAYGELKSLQKMVIASVICALVFFVGSLVVEPIADFVDYCRTVVGNIGNHENFESELKWTPREKAEDESIFDIFTNIPGDGVEDDVLYDERETEEETAQSSEANRPVQGPSAERTEIQGPHRPTAQPAPTPATTPGTDSPQTSAPAPENTPAVPEVRNENETAIDFT